MKFAVYVEGQAEMLFVADVPLFRSLLTVSSANKNQYYRSY